MFKVELGKPDEYDYYCFLFETYKDATDFISVIINNGYMASVSYDEENE